MPFTLSHPAAILPLLRPLGRRAVLSALVVGSMTPDLPNYLGAQVARPHTHSLLSIAWFSIPVGWLSYLVFQRVLRRPAVFLLPGPLRARLDPRPRIGAVGPVTLCLALGALTHVAWDSFTHDWHLVMRELPGLRQWLLDVWGHPFWSYRFLQHGNTLLGAAVLALATWRWMLRLPPRPLDPEPRSARRLRAGARAAALLLPGGLGLAVALRVAPAFHDFGSFVWFLAYVVVAGLTTLALVLAVVGVVLRVADTGRMP
jgi:hypothetical protein